MLLVAEVDLPTKQNNTRNSKHAKTYHYLIDIFSKTHYASAFEMVSYKHEQAGL